MTEKFVVRIDYADGSTEIVNVEASDVLGAYDTAIEKRREWKEPTSITLVRKK